MRRERGYTRIDKPFRGTGGPQGRTAAGGELLVATDLLDRGYEVYRALSAQAPHDLIVSVGGVLLKVEVKTRSRNENGHFPHPNLWDIADERRPDVIAVVDRLAEYSDVISYFPPVDIAAKQKLDASLDDEPGRLLERALHTIEQFEKEMQAVGQRGNYWPCARLLDAVRDYADHLGRKLYRLCHETDIA